MDAHDLTEPKHHPLPAALPEEPTVGGLPYEHLRAIWDLFPDAFAAVEPSGAPASQPRAELVRLLNDTSYRARVDELLRRDESAVAYYRAPEQAELYRTLAGAHLLPASPAGSGTPDRPAVPSWVWKYSALALSTGGAIALGGYGIGAAAPGLAQLPAIFATAGQALMSLAVVVVLVGVVLASRGAQRSTSKGGTTVNIRRAVFRRSNFHS
ncbi:hypothetical protein QMK19_23170 [Streptomyces sp. H10-C2]|uniref:hypothetical protein n=1 Tax=unclassified Streptomyces TaxID=2593676 RepID=UPI0024BA6C72|nr:MULTISPECIES: hypothetical protein [unclassified Streptomyces]MDJ0342808.1 hypothetical protein [Streptomyces sp. PH10-H1]MDJ0372486.1 hypothetical protein [Streptomyces sp. H10-C2]